MKFLKHIILCLVLIGAIPISDLGLVHAELAAEQKKKKKKKKKNSYIKKK